VLAVNELYLGVPFSLSRPLGEALSDLNSSANEAPKTQEEQTVFRGRLCSSLGRARAGLCASSTRSRASFGSSPTRSLHRQPSFSVSVFLLRLRCLPLLWQSLDPAWLRTFRFL